MSMSSDSSSLTTGSLSSTSESDTNEPSGDSSVYSDPSSLSIVSRLNSSTDSDTESESGSNPDSGTEADDKLDASAPTAEAQLGELVREFIRGSYSHRYQMACTRTSQNQMMSYICIRFLIFRTYACRSAFAF
ncbi:hypothetical protein BDR07DRAFT_1421781 [Suillus spraguei]|nr:hypothetical protein BDR07DRAFT_1421781 [Suillus spraguei]